MNAIFFSDVHLRDSDSVKSQLFLRFIEREVSQFERIYILGDLFDVWPGTDSYLVKRFAPVLSVLKNLSLAGHEIHYVEGNHDFRLGKRFADETGAIIHPNEYRTTFGDKKVYMVHGDLGNRRAIGYALLRKVLRMDLVHNVKNAFPEAWVFDVGLRSSQMSRTYNAKDKLQLAKIRQIYRATACSFFEAGHDVVLMGHTHLPDSMQATIEGRPCVYYNTGDWVQNFTYLELKGTEFYTKSHPIKGA